MLKINKKYINKVVKNSLEEDLFPGKDITTNLLANNPVIKAKIICNQNSVIGGLEFAKTAFKILDKKTKFIPKVNEGDEIKKGKTIAIINGKAKSILTGERVALNFLSLTSAVATKTRKFVDIIKKKNCKICCTRKTLPNLRLLQKYAVKLGGGLNHRFNLNDEYLIKDNHISTSNNIKKIVLKAIKNKKNKKITLEIDKLSQLREVLGFKFHRVLFDNMSLKNLKIGVKIAKKYYETEASGGVTIKNIRKISSTGVSRISVGEITHSISSIDFKLEI